MLEPGAAAAGVGGRRGGRWSSSASSSPPRASTCTRFDNELALPRRRPPALRRAARRPGASGGLRCGPLSLPNHKLIPDVALDGRPAGESACVARSDPRAAARRKAPRRGARRRSGRTRILRTRRSRPDRRPASIAPPPAPGLATRDRDRYDRYVRRRRPALRRPARVGAAPRRRRGRRRAGRAGALRRASCWRARPAPVGRRAGPALRLQRRRERALRAEGDRAVRPQLEPGLLRQPARATRTCCTSSSRVWFGGARRRLASALRDRPDRRSSSSRACVAAVLGTRRRSGCSTSPARACSTAASACSPRRCWPSPSCRSSTRTSRSTTCRRWLPSASRCRHGGHPAPRARARLRRSPAPGSGWPCATKYTGGHRAAAAARGGRAQLGAGRRRAGAVRGARARRRCRARRLRRSPTRTRCSTSRRSATGLSHQSSAADDGCGKLGLDPRQRHRSTTCGRSPGGWAGCPALAALGGARRAGVRDRARGCWCSSRRRSLFLRLHGHAGRASSGAGCCRSFPLVCLLAAYGAVVLRGSVARAGPRCAPALTALVGVALLRAGAPLQRALGPRPVARTTRATSPATGWSSTSRAGSKIVVEPVVPDGWAQDIGAAARGADRPTATAGSSTRPVAPRSTPDGRQRPAARARRQHRGLRAHAAPRARSTTTSAAATAGSSPARRSAAARAPSPREVPEAIAYYASCARRGDVVYAARPTAPGDGPGALQLRLVVRLLPAGLRAARAR